MNSFFNSAFLISVFCTYMTFITCKLPVVLYNDYGWWFYQFIPKNLKI